MTKIALADPLSQSPFSIFFLDPSKTFLNPSKKGEMVQIFSTPFLPTLLADAWAGMVVVLGRARPRCWAKHHRRAVHACREGQSQWRINYGFYLY